MSNDDSSAADRGPALSEGLGPIADLVACLRDTSGRHINCLYDKRAADDLERLAELADSEGARAVNYLRRARKAEKVLRELVALEEMRLRLRQLHEMGHGTDYADYHRLLPLAWDAAREVLGPNDQFSGGPAGPSRTTGRP